MTTLNVLIPDDLMEFVNGQVADGLYGSPDECVRAVLREAQRRRAGRRVLEAKIREGLDSGPAEPMTDADWVALRQQAIDGLAGETIRP